MARIKITNSKTGDVREVEEFVLTSHLHRKGWRKIDKFEVERFPVDDEQVEDEKEKEEIQVEKPKTRGRKPKTDK